MVGGGPVRRMCKYLVVVGSLCSIVCSQMRLVRSMQEYFTKTMRLLYNHHVRDDHTISGQVHVI